MQQSRLIFYMSFGCFLGSSSLKSMEIPPKDKKRLSPEATSVGREQEKKLKTVRPQDVSYMPADARPADKDLFEAAAAGNEENVLTALEQGANKDFRDKLGRTPLYSASEIGHSAIVRLLLEKKANLETPTEWGVTPLLIAATSGHKDIVVMLLNSGAQMKIGSISTTPLQTATENGHTAIVQLLLEKGADGAATDDNGQTLLHLAALKGHEALVTLLLNRGAPINARCKLNGTPLFVAAQAGHLTVVKTLLAHPQLDIDCPLSRDLTPLAVAFHAQHGDIVRLLIMHGATAIQDHLDWALPNPLEHGAASGKLQEVENYLSHNPKAPIETIDRALAYAAGRGHGALVNRLLQPGAHAREALKMINIILQQQPFLPNNPNHYQAIRNALMSGLSLSEHILERPSLRPYLMGKNFYRLPDSLQEKLDLSPEEKLICACHKGNLDDVKKSLELCANRHALDHDGQNVMHIAAQHEDPEKSAAMVRLLLEKGFSSST